MMTYRLHTGLLPALARHLAVVATAALMGAPAAAQEVRSGLEGLAWQSPLSMHKTERSLVNALRAPLMNARNCEAALEHWFSGRQADSRGDKAAALSEWAAGLRVLGDLEALTAPPWGGVPRAVLRPVVRIEGAPLYLLSSFVVQWTIEGAPYFGVLMLPDSRIKGHAFPLFVYVTDSDDGLSDEEFTWLARFCRKGYAVFAPALPGSMLLRARASVAGSRPLISSGEASDLAASARALWAAVGACGDLPGVRRGHPAAAGVGRGGTIVLLALGLEPACACVVVVDAWRVNPFRFYWARMAREENHWADWSRFCSRPVADQLRTMVIESPVHRTLSRRSPVLLILPEADRATINQRAHEDLLEHLQTEEGEQAGAELAFADGDIRAFARAGRGDPGFATYRLLSQFIFKHAPPDDGLDAILKPMERITTESPGDTMP